MGADAPSAKERADAKRYAELSATLSRNKLKKMTCFAYLKGRCAKGDACTFLHAGEPNKKKNRGKRKREEAQAERPAARAPKPQTWLCPKCGNKNWMRREVCNGARCADQRRPEGLAAAGAGLPPAAAQPHPTAVRGGVTTGGNCRLFLRKLSYEITEEKLREFFAPAEVTEVHWLKDKRNGQINAGFAQFATAEGAAQGLAKGGRPCCGRPIRIEYAKAAPEKEAAGAAEEEPAEERGAARRERQEEAKEEDSSSSESESESEAGADSGSDSEDNEQWSSDSEDS